MKIGDYVILIQDIDMHNKVYKKGHIFKIYNESDRGWDLIDRNGDKIDETRFCSDRYELYDIKKSRKEKLKKINGKY